MFLASLLLATTLSIPDINCNVELKEGCSQKIVDSECAAIYNSSVYGINDNIIVADHRTQEFKNLKNVEVGTTAYIVNEWDDIIELECIEVCEGKLDSIGYILVDGEYMENRYDDVYIFYTCKKEKGKRVVTYWKEK